MPPKFVNVRRVILKHKHATKRSFLEKFLRQSVVQAGETNFLSPVEMFDECCRVISMWTEEDKPHGHTEHLMKKGSFFQGKY